MISELLTLEWCREHLKGYETKEDKVSVEFVVAKCSNGSDSIVAFNKARPSLKHVPRCFVSNFFVERIRTVGDLRDLVCALGFGNCSPWLELTAAPMTESKNDEPS